MSLSLKPVSTLSFFLGRAKAPHAALKQTLQKHSITDFNQHCSVEEIKLLQSTINHFSIFHANIRSIQKNFSKLCELLSNICVLPDIIVLSETWMSNSSFFKPALPGYNFIYSPSVSNRSGGVAFFVKTCRSYEIVEGVSFEQCDVDDL